MLYQSIMSTNALGEELRSARRNFGLSQAQLSGLLGLSQARISRWESGREDIPVKHRLRIVDLFLNSRGQISPLIETMLRSNPDLVVLDAKREGTRILRESPLILKAYGLEKSDVEGAEYARIFDAQWINLANFSTDWCAVTYFRDVELARVSGRSRGFRCRVKLLRVGIEDYDEIVIARHEIVGPPKGETDLPTVDCILP